MEPLCNDRTQQVVRAGNSGGDVAEDIGGVTSPADDSCELSLSDSFLSQTNSSVGGLTPRGGLNRRSTTIDSFRSGLSSPSSEQGQGSKFGQCCRQPRPASETKDLTGSDPHRHHQQQHHHHQHHRASLQQSSPNIYGAAGAQGAVQTAVMVSQRGLKHKVIPCAAYTDSCNEKQRLLSSPKHSSSFPVLKKFAISGSTYRSVVPPDIENMFNSMCHRKSDGMVFHTSQMLPSTTLVQSSSFLRYIGERLKPPTKKGTDLTNSLKRSIESNGRGAGQKPDKEPAISSCSRNNNNSQSEQQDNRMKGGTRALLIQKQVSVCVFEFMGAFSIFLQK
ncbi:hypothetical protein Btru_044055 [Bulinus truncatus]|nr:hypothetical protein Btru_044055 [Bulinus truncatus]